MRDKQFFVNSIKMDLYRVVTAAGDINKELSVRSVSEFMQHADKDFEKMKLTKREIGLKKQLQKLFSRVNNLKDPLSRLRWVEDVMTIRCRL